MADETVNRRLREFVAKNFYVADTSSFEDTTSLLDRGVIDSTGVLELVSFVEAEYGISVDDEDIVPANFDSIAALAGFVARKRA